MKFLDRKEEISELHRALNGSKPNFIVVFGRRRLGKSTLIKKVLTSKDVYYMAADLVGSVQRVMLKDQLSGKFPEIALADYPDWESLLTMLNKLTDSRFTLCLDEFPYMVNASPELPSIIQRLVDSGSMRFNLIICGSSQRMMQNMVLSPSEPLFGRANAIMDIQPIPIAFLQEALSLGPVATIEEFCVWGGVPRYWELREEYPSLDEAIRGTMLSPTAVLYDEPKRLFLDNMNATVQSESLMSVIAAGASRLSEIAARMGREATALSAPLGRLIQMKYLRREIPFGESPKKSKKGIYLINDPLMDFYYTFIMPNLSAIGRGRRGFVMDVIKEKFNGYVATHWEHLCREAVSDNLYLGRRWKDASRWWGTVAVPGSDAKTSREMEFDVMAESIDGKAILVGECKWTNPEIASELYNKLMENASLLPFAKDKEIVPVIFLKNRPKDSHIHGNIHLLFPEDIIRMAHGED